MEASGTRIVPLLFPRKKASDLQNLTYFADGLATTLQCSLRI